MTEVKTPPIRFDDRPVVVAGARITRLTFAVRRPQGRADAA